ncbi:MAG: tyrosine-type recombinase/integrase [Acidimicrobiales bacterium]
MSAELFHVMAAVLRRHTKHRPAVPLVTRFDTHDKETSSPQPFLFQRFVGSTRAVFSYTVVLHMLWRLCDELAQDRPAFAQARFAPHDFRRLFATDLINSGLPIHIGAALLGHLDLGTTRGYVAVFEEDVVRHYQAYLARRRHVRPEHEYRPATSAEWTEFEEHFDKRKVELGNCGRPYGTPCSHEHACVRCPMLRVDPRMLPRLDELERDLHVRRDRAVHEGWLGEVEGIDLTLTFLRQKRDEAERHSTTTVLLRPPTKARPDGARADSAIGERPRPRA